MAPARLVVAGTHRRTRDHEGHHQADPLIPVSSPATARLQPRSNAVFVSRRGQAQWYGLRGRHVQHAMVSEVLRMMRMPRVTSLWMLIAQAVATAICVASCVAPSKSSGGPAVAQAESSVAPERMSATAQAESSEVPLDGVDCSCSEQEKKNCQLLGQVCSAGGRNGKCEKECVDS